MVRSGIPLAFALALPAQVPQVDVTGTLSISYQPASGPVRQQSRTIQAADVLQLPGVATAQVVLGTTSALQLTADAPPFGCYGCWSQAAGDVRFELRSASPAAGVLRLQVAPACFMLVPPYADVHDDGHWDLVGVQGNQSIDVPAVLGTVPLVVRVVANSVNFGGATCSYAVNLTWLPQPAALQALGAPCGADLAGALTSTATAARLWQLAIGGAAGIVGAVGLGGPAGPAVPCAPAALPVAALYLAPASALRVPLPVAAALHGAFTVQYVELLPNGALAFSNAIAAFL